MAAYQKEPVSTNPRLFYGYIIVICSLLISVATLGAHNSIGVFFKPLIEDFGWSRALLSGAVSVGLIVNGVLAIIMGGLTHKIGPRVVTTIAGIMSGAGYLLMAQASAIWQVYIFLGLMIGVGMGGAWVPLLTTVTRWFVKRRGTVTGVVVASTGIGPLLGPLASSALLASYGWQTSYTIIGGATLVIILAASQFLRLDPSQMGLRPDGEGRTEKHELKPDLHGSTLKEAMHTRQFWFFFGMFFCMGYFYFSILVHIIPHATDLGISTVNAAGVLAVSGVLTIVGNISMGAVSDKTGYRRIIIICYILAAASMFWLLVAKETWMLYLFSAVLGFAWGGFAAMESPTAAWLFGLRQHGLILASLIFGLTIGASIGPYLTGYVFDKTGDYQIDFVIFAALSIIGVILSFLLRPTSISKADTV